MSMLNRVSLAIRFEFVRSPASIGIARVSNESSLSIGLKSRMMSSLTRPPGLKVKSPTRKPSTGLGSCAAGTAGAAGAGAAGAPASGAGALSCAAAEPATARRARSRPGHNAHRASPLMSSPRDAALHAAYVSERALAARHAALEEPPARCLLRCEVLDGHPRVAVSTRRDGLPRRLADDGDAADTFESDAVPQTLGIESPVMVRAGVALHPNEDPDGAESRDRRAYQVDERTLIGARHRAGHGCGDKARRTAGRTDHHVTELYGPKCRGGYADLARAFVPQTHRSGRCAFRMLRRLTLAPSASRGR